MKQLLALLLCGILCITGCNKDNTDNQAMALTKPAPDNVTDKSVPNTALLEAMLPEETIADYLPKDAWLYIHFPDIAEVTTTLASSPLKELWRSPAFQKVFSMGLGGKTWQMIHGLAGKAAQGQLRGSLEMAVHLPDPAMQPPQPSLCFLWRTGDQTAEVKKAMTDFMISLETNVNGLRMTQEAVHDVPVRKLAWQNGNAMTLYFGEVGGTLRLSTDAGFFGPWQRSRPDSLRAHPNFQDTLTQIGKPGKTLALAYANLQGAISLVTEKMPVSPSLFDSLGVTGLKCLGLSMEKDGGQVKDLVYIKWPVQQRGIFNPLLCSANVKGALAIVPDNVSSLSVMGVDLQQLWKEATALVQTEFPQAKVFLTQVSAQAKFMMGNNISELLAAFGTDVLNYTMKGDDGLPVSVMLFAVKDSELLRQIVLNLDNKFKSNGKRLLLDSIEAIEIFGLTPPISPVSIYFAIAEKHFVVSQNLNAVKNFIQNRKGHKTPLAGAADVRKIMNTPDIGGLSFLDLGEQMAGLMSIQQAAGNHPLGKMPGMSDNPWLTEELLGTFKKVGVDLGKMWSMTFIKPHGILVECRSSCGITLFGASTGAVTAATAVPRILKDRQEKREQAIVGIIRKVVKGQYDFKMRYTRYAQNLRELCREGFVEEAGLHRGFSNGYLFKLKANGPNAWTFDVRPSEGQGQYFYCDQTGTIRTEPDKPARSESPVIENQMHY